MLRGPARDRRWGSLHGHTVGRASSLPTRGRAGEAIGASDVGSAQGRRCPSPSRPPNDAKELVHRAFHGKLANMNEARARLSLSSKVLAWTPSCAILYGLVVAPLIRLAYPDPDPWNTSRPEHRFFWSGLAILTLALLATRRQARRPEPVPAWAWFLGAYMAIAGISIFWSVARDTTILRYVQQAFILIAVVLPAYVFGQKRNLYAHLSYPFSLAIFFNTLSLFVRSPSPIGHPGIYDHKNTLGEVSGLGFVVGVHCLLHRSLRVKIMGAFMALGSMSCLLASQSKTSLSVALICPMLSLCGALLTYWKGIPSFLTIVFILITTTIVTFDIAVISGSGLDDVLSLYFGDPTFTGRTEVWSFVLQMVQRHPIFGWGYQAFWLSGPEAPSLREGPSWVALMPHAHDGYLDVLLDTGVVGLAIAIGLLVSMAARLEYCGRDFTERTMAISLFLFFIAHNCLETSIFRGFGDSWMVLLVIAASVCSDTSGARHRSRMAYGEPASDAPAY